MSTPYDLDVTTTEDGATVINGDPLSHVRTFTADELEDADFRQVTNTSATIVLPESASRGEALDHLAKTIPSN